MRCQEAVVTLLLTATLATSEPRAVQAQQYPTRPITLVLGLSAGGAVDVVSRLFAEKVSQILGQRVIVENRSGGAGIPAALAVRQAAADGYTLMVVLGGLHTFVPAMQTIPFDPIGDFSPVTLLYSAPGFVVVTAASPANSVSELIDLGKRKQNGLTFGSPGSGSPAHIMGLLFQQKTGVPMLHIPYRGGGQMMSDLLAGQFDVAFATYTNFKSHLEGRQVKALAIARPTRWGGTPGVPTLIEQGYDGIDVDNFFGVAGPRGLPPGIVQKLNQAFAQASQDPEFAQKLEELGIIAITSKPDELTKLLLDDTARLTPIIQKFGIKP